MQYVVLRKDLGASLGWPLGSLCAQAAHASVAAVWEHRDHTDTVAYCAPDAIDQMHKVVLEVEGEQLVNLAAKLAPERGRPQAVDGAAELPDVPRDAAYRKDEVAQWFKKCNLAKGNVVSEREATTIALTGEREYTCNDHGVRAAKPRVIDHLSGASLVFELNL